MDILDYRMIILGTDGKIYKYDYNYGQHQDCLDEFAKVNGYNYSNYRYVISEGNGIFWNCGNQMVVSILPSSLNEHQLYLLDYIENWLDNVLYMEVNIEQGKSNKEFIFEENIRKKFSEEIIQYYYSDSKKVKKSLL